MKDKRIHKRIMLSWAIASFTTVIIGMLSVNPQIGVSVSLFALSILAGWLIKKDDRYTPVDCLVLCLVPGIIYLTSLYVLYHFCAGVDESLIYFCISILSGIIAGIATGFFTKMTILCK